MRQMPFGELDKLLSVWFVLGEARLEQESDSDGLLDPLPWRLLQVRGVWAISACGDFQPMDKNWCLDQAKGEASDLAQPRGSASLRGNEARTSWRVGVQRS